MAWHGAVAAHQWRWRRRRALEEGHQGVREGGASVGEERAAWGTKQREGESGHVGKKVVRGRGRSSGGEGDMRGGGSTSGSWGAVRRRGSSMEKLEGDISVA
jgi:hypothetical protein